mgnify:CR=1 FL=1
MGEKNAPARIWACMDGPMVGLFVSGGDTADWPEYIRADIADKLIEALVIIAGKRPCLDNLMGNADIALAALASLQTQEQSDAS